MEDENKPFHEEDYEAKGKDIYPVLNIQCILGGDRIPVKCLADTGCDGGIVLLKKELEILRDHYQNLDIGMKINEIPLEVCVGDGHIVGFDVYVSKLELKGEQKTVELWVIDSEEIIGQETNSKKNVKDVFPVVGRNFLNHFDVLFQGKDKKLAVFKK